MSPLRNQPMRTSNVLLAFVLLSLMGCMRPQTQPDLRIPHRLAKPATVTILVRQDDGRYLPARVRVDAGWWIASPVVVD